MKYARRVDDNQKQIVAALRKIGCRVYISSGASNGFPDLTCFIAGRVELIECKAPGKRKQLKPKQVDLHALAKEAGYTIHIVETAEEAIAAVIHAAHTRAATKEELCP